VRCTPAFTDPAASTCTNRQNARSGPEGATFRAAGSIMAATARMGETGRRLAAAHQLPAGTRPALGFGPSQLGTTRWIWRLLYSAGELWYLFREFAFLPYRGDAGDVHGISAVRIRRIFIHAPGPVAGVVAHR